jgi:hypothetical protein
MTACAQPEQPERQVLVELAELAELAIGHIFSPLF